MLTSLNPCFSGGWSRRFSFIKNANPEESLNPCFSGGWSRRKDVLRGHTYTYLVLILVLVEDGLGGATDAAEAAANIAS